MACDIFNCVSFSFPVLFRLCPLSRKVAEALQRIQANLRLPSLSQWLNLSISIGVTITSVILYMLVCFCFLGLKYINGVSMLKDGSSQPVCFAVRC